MSNREQGSPENLFEGNELICAKLLGWERWPDPQRPAFQWRKLFTATSWEVLQTPSFTTWAEAGLILDALQRMSVIGVAASITYDNIIEELCIDLQRRELTPARVRAAALEYIRRVP
jgi:hypothetical protein